MATVKSIFGPYADNLQAVVDNALDKFVPTWFDRYFTVAPPQSSLTWTSVLGANRVEAAATIVARGSAMPLRSRPTLTTLTGEIPVIGEKFAMKEDDYRNFLLMQELPVSDTVRRQQLLDLMFNDVKKVGDSVFKKIDLMVAEMVSTGKVTIDINTNPDGTITSASIDMGIPSANKSAAAVNWATAATATPITDIETVKQAAAAKGISFGKILMHPTAWSLFRNTTQVANTLAGFYNIPKGIVVATLPRVNEFLQASGYPVIELVDLSIGVEKDGVISTSNPFSTTVVAFVPDGPLGEIKNALALEQYKPVPQVSYANFRGALISKWGQNEPWQEITKSEYNAFPTLDSATHIFLLGSNASVPA